jgi:hypothetical protein
MVFTIYPTFVASKLELRARVGDVVEPRTKTKAKTGLQCPLQSLLPS